MAYLHLPHHLFLAIEPSIWQRCRQEDLEIIATQQRMHVSVTEPGLQHELRCHHDQGHVTMPGLPLPGLVLRHSNMTFGVLECSLDPETLRLHFRQLCGARLIR